MFVVGFERAKVVAKQFILAEDDGDNNRLLCPFVPIAPCRDGEQTPRGDRPGL
jgi:hypothetical protein